MPIDVLTLDTVDSTMLEAERQAAAGRAGPLVICAREQTGGTGRHGRAWTSPPGNLYWTMLLDDPADRPRDAGLAFAAGLAVMDAVQEAGVPSGRLTLKWPNDVLLDGRKLAGVLVQASVGLRAHTVIGIGVNVGFAPTGTAYPAIALAEVGPASPIDRLRDALTAAMLNRRATLRRDGLGSLVEQAAARLHGRGAPVAVALDRDRTQLVSGLNEGLGLTGELRVRCPDGTIRELIAGDILG